MPKGRDILSQLHDSRNRKKKLKSENIEVTLELHALQMIVSNLKKNYEDSKGVCPIYRYSMLKDMIKEAIEAARKDNLAKPKELGGTVKDLRLKEETKRGLKAMHKEEIVANTEKKRQQVKRIRCLQSDYENSKQLCCLYRYKEMKRMIKNTIENMEERKDYTTDDERHPLLSSGRLDV